MLESRRCEELHLALFLLSWVSKDERGGGGVTSQPGVSRAGTLDFGGIEFQSPVVSIQRGVIALESWWCVELLCALFLFSWMSKGVRGKGEVTS